MYPCRHLQFNPKAKVSDFAFLIASTILFGNIFSILVFKTRFF